MDYYYPEYRHTIDSKEILLLRRLNASTIEKEVMDGREALFGRFISNVDGDATEKYVAMIKRVMVEKPKGSAKNPHNRQERNFSPST